jgi:hypothetical protein
VESIHVSRSKSARVQVITILVLISGRRGDGKDSEEGFDMTSFL